MPVERDGRFTFSDDRVADGINQSASESSLRYRRVQNMNIFRSGALTKDRGIRRIHSTNIDSSNDLLGGFDGHYLDGTQQVVVVSTTDAHRWNSTTQEFDAQSLSLANARPKMLMFADQLYLMNGTQYNSMTSAGTWSTAPGGGLPAAPKFAVIHAERMIVAGLTGTEYLFYPSEIRNTNTFDGGLSVIVETPRDNAITNLARLGHLMIVQTAQATLAYFLGTANPRDWDHNDVSMNVGCVSHASWAAVTRGRGDNARDYGFFWSDQGPMMLLEQSGVAPQLVSLWEPLARSVRGEEFQEMPALEIARYTSVVAAYCPEYNQIRFGVSKLGSSENDMQLRVDVDSAIEYANGQRDYPLWSYRDNANLGYFPSDVIFPIKVDLSGLPAVLGQDRCFSARDGIVFEMDARGVFKDLETTDIPFFVHRSGYDGAADGVRTFTKTCRWAYIRSTQVGGGTLKSRVLADGGRDMTEDTVSLDRGLSVWGSATWGEGKWNCAEFVTERADHGAQGERFEHQIFDDGNIAEDFQIDGWELAGYLENRR